MLYNTIDISHWQTIQNHRKVRDAGIELVIHKATQGLRYIDNKYLENKKAFENLGVHWGSYHFGTRGDGVYQANHFLSIADPRGLLILDLETNPNGESMTLAEAESFVRRVKHVTGRYPGLHSGHTIKEMLKENSDTVLANCWLWIAQYGEEEPQIPGAWKNWTFWQYTDGHKGPSPHEVPGIGECDRDVFSGDDGEFEEFITRNTQPDVIHH